MYENKIIKYRLEIKNTSPLVIGNGEDGIEGIQMQNGHAKIPATSMAGIFRNDLSKSKIYASLYEAIYLEKQQGLEKTLKRNEKRRQSMMSLEDSFTKNKIDTEFHIGKRTNIRIDPMTGAAQEKKLFDTFYIQPGQIFELELEFRKVKQDNLSVNSEEFKNIDDDNLFKQAEQAFDTFIEKLHLGDAVIGAGGNKGFGRFEVIKLSKTNYNFMNKKDLEKYINNESLPYENYVPLKEKTYALNEFVVEMICPQGMIIKDKILTKDGNKWIDSFRENKDLGYKIPASTLKGLARGYCESLDENEELVNFIFGSEESKGKIKFSDIDIKENQELRKHRISIDRFTGGARKGAMVNEILVTWTKPVKWRIDFSEIEAERLEETKTIILKMIRALSLGQLRIGSGSSVGYGRMEITKINVFESEDGR